MDDVDDLVDSLNSATDWNERTLALVMARKARYRQQIAQLEPLAENMKHTNTRLTTAIPILGAGATIGGAIEMVREIIIFRDGSILPSIINMCILVLMFVMGMLSTALAGYQKSQDYPNKIGTAFECISDYNYLMNTIDNQLSRKARNRTGAREFIELVLYLEQNVTRKQNAALDVNNSGIVSMTDDIERQLATRMTERRRSLHGGGGSPAASTSITPDN